MPWRPARERLIEYILKIACEISKPGLRNKAHILLISNKYRVRSFDVTEKPAVGTLSIRRLTCQHHADRCRRTILIITKITSCTRCVNRMVYSLLSLYFQDFDEPPLPGLSARQLFVHVEIPSRV